MGVTVFALVDHKGEAAKVGMTMRRTRSVARVCDGLRGLHRQVAPEPTGCCCSYGERRERFTQETCASEGEFQGWRYTWHAGECTERDTYPAPDYVPSRH